MKCSDCKFWKTWECQGNPDAKDSNYAETFACFIPISGEDEIEQEIQADKVEVEKTETPNKEAAPHTHSGLMTFKKVLGWIFFLGGICLALSDVTILLSRGNMESPFWNYSLPWTLIYLAEDVVFIWGGWLLSHPVKKTNMRKPLGWTMIGIVILNIIHSCYNIIISNKYSPLLLIFPVFAIIQILSGWWLSHPSKSIEPTSQSSSESYGESEHHSSSL